jgi:hypothetical protein
VAADLPQQADVTIGDLRLIGGPGHD